MGSPDFIKNPKMILPFRRFKRFDPKIHQEFERDLLFKNFVEVPSYVTGEDASGSVISLFNQEWLDAEYEMHYEIRPR